MHSNQDGNNFGIFFSTIVMKFLEIRASQAEFMPVLEGTVPKDVAEERKGA